MMTTTTVTTKQLVDLRNEAYVMDDAAMFAICAIAIDGWCDEDEQSGAGWSARALRTIATTRMSQDRAIGICVDAINGALAMQEAA